MFSLRNVFCVVMLALLLCKLFVLGGCTTDEGPADAVTPVNNAPQPTAAAIFTTLGNSGSSQIHVNDPNIEQSHTFKITTVPGRGTAMVNSTGLVTYTPGSNFTATDRLVITVADNGIPPLLGTVPIDVIGVRPNIVLILTDDQRWDTLWAMPILQEHLVAHGVTFTNAYATTPLCCPFRASLLAGGLYAHHTGVLTNRPPNGGVQAFHDTDTLALRLQQAGYKTGLIGKYLNKYWEIVPYVPPGWTQFVASQPNRQWTRVRAIAGSSASEPTQGKRVGPIKQYLANFHTEAALRFLEQYGDGPFFLYFSPNAPHFPAVPAAGDANGFAGFLHRERAYQESDLTDKPAWVRHSAALFSGYFQSLAEEDEFHRNQLRSLQAVDQAIGAIIRAIQQKGKLHQTVFIFTSDNGYMWGEHGLFAKGKPYEESIRVPLVIRMPGVTERTAKHLVASNLDIGATLFALAGITQATDGLSLLPVLHDPATAWREEVLIESYDVQRWAGLRIKRPNAEWKYVEHISGEKELYDLLHDPYEEDSQHANPAYREKMEAFAVRLAARKGLIITVRKVPHGQVGQTYSFQVTAWGGQTPYTWDMVDGQLPEGLSLDSASGLISGIPTRAEIQRVSLRVYDSSIGSYTKAPQVFILPVQFVIDSP